MKDRNMTAGASAHRAILGSTKQTRDMYTDERDERKLSHEMKTWEKPIYIRVTATALYGYGSLGRK